MSVRYELSFTWDDSEILLEDVVMSLGYEAGVGKGATNYDILRIGKNKKGELFCTAYLTRDSDKDFMRLVDYISNIIFVHNVYVEKIW